MDEKTRSDALGIYLTGGASNTDPSLSLGGAVSSEEVEGVNWTMLNPIPGLIINHVSPNHSPGVARIEINAGTVRYTPPATLSGASVVISEGESKTVTGNDSERFIRITRLSGKRFEGVSTLKIKRKINGVLSMDNVLNAERVSGSSKYRAVILNNHSVYPIEGIEVLARSNGGQSTWEMGTEEVVADSIQSIANESTAPISISFSLKATVSILQPGDKIGLWIKRVFPSSGIVSPEEEIQFKVQFKAH